MVRIRSWPKLKRAVQQSWRWLPSTESPSGYQFRAMPAVRSARPYFGEELLQQLIESWGGALGVPGTLVSLKLHLPFLVVFHMRCPSGKVSGSGCGGVPFGVVQQFIIDGRICRILPPDLHVSPPRGRTSWSIRSQGSSNVETGGSFASQLLGHIFVYSPWSWDFPFILLPPFGHKLLRAT